MSEPTPPSPSPTSRARVGRPRRGTESARANDLINAATRVFLRDGYGHASIDKVASEAGVSTRTIYERFKNKADLLAGVINRLVDRDMAKVLATAELDALDPAQALIAIGHTVASRVCDPDTAALFRIVATEAHRFPELASRLRSCNKMHLENAVADYFRAQIQRRTLALADPDRAALLFLQLVCAALQECVLFGTDAELARFDIPTHVRRVVDLFLQGAAPRIDS